MNFHHRRRSVPQLNTTSTADISFMLFLPRYHQYGRGQGHHAPAAATRTTAE